MTTGIENPKENEEAIFKNEVLVLAEYKRETMDHVNEKLIDALKSSE